VKVGVPSEVKNHEYRVAITPIGVHELVAATLDGRVHDAPVMVAVLTAKERGLIGGGPV
jgi:NAD/NADP transhydrogenase alpha subunit